MTTDANDQSQRVAARVAGLAYLISVAIVVTGEFAIRARLMVPGNPAETARAILVNERLFRLYIACNLTYCVGMVVLLSALYTILKPVGQNLAFLAACCRLVYALTWVAISLNLFSALRLLKGPEYLQAFGPGRLQAMTRLYLSGYDTYYVGLLFYGLAATFVGYLFFKSRYIPRSLAAFGVIASAWCTVCTFILFIFPNFPDVVNLWWFDSPMAVFEIALSLWLLFKGLKI